MSPATPPTPLESMVAALVAERGRVIALQMIVELAGRFGFEIPDAGNVESAHGIAESWERCATAARSEAAALRRQAGVDASEIETMRVERRLLDRLAEGFQVERDELRRQLTASEEQRLALALAGDESERYLGLVVARATTAEGALASEKFRADAAVELVTKWKAAADDAIAKGLKHLTRAETAERHLERAMRDGAEAVNGWTKTGKDLAAEKMAHASTRDARAIVEVDRVELREALASRPLSAATVFADLEAEEIAPPVLGTPHVEPRYRSESIRLAKRMPPAPSQTCGSPSSSTASSSKGPGLTSPAIVQLRVLQVEQLTGIEDSFFCPPFVSTVRAGTCLDRQRLVAVEQTAGSSRLARETRQNRKRFDRCVGCVTGISVEAQLVARDESVDAAE